MESIQHCLLVMTKPLYPKDYTNAKSVEGDIRLEWAKTENQEDNIKSAMQNYQEALSVYDDHLFEGNHEELLGKIKKVSGIIFDSSP